MLRGGVPAFLFSAAGILLPALGQSSTDTSPATAVRLDAAAYQRLVDENLQLRKERAGQEAEVNDLRRRNASLLVDLQDMERRKSQMVLLMSQMRTPDETKLELERLQSEKKILLQEIDRMRKPAAEAAPSANSVTKPPVAPAPGSDLFRKVEKENTELRQEAIRMREVLQKGAMTNATLDRACQSLKSEMALSEEKIAKLAAELDLARQREATLRKALEAQARKAFEADREAKALQEKQQEAERQRLAAEAAARARSQPTPRPAGDGAVPDRGIEVGSLLADAQRALAGRRVDEAEELYLKAFKIDPDNSRVSYNLGVLYGDYRRDAARAVKFYRHYLKLAPKAPDAAQVRAWIMELEARSSW